MRTGVLPRGPSEACRRNNLCEKRFVYWQPLRLYAFLPLLPKLKSKPLKQPTTKKKFCMPSPAEAMEGKRARLCVMQKGIFTELPLSAATQVANADSNSAQKVVESFLNKMPQGKFRVLHTFDFTHGAVPSTNLIQDASGNLYGTTPWGGNSTCELHGCGVLFKLTPSGKFSVLYSFTGGSDGGNPGSGLIRDAKGNLYGTTALTASSSGEVFELTTSGQLEVLYSFTGGTDGEGPNGVIQDSKGNLYGSTFGGGAFGNGTVFKLDTSGTETVLYSFKGKSDGGEPTSRLIMDSAGNLYGTTQLFGDHKGNCDLPNSPPGCGTAFKVDTAGVFSVLVKFDYADGDNPYNSPLTPDTHGNFSGTTLKGGDGCGGVGCGVAYKLSAAGKESVLYNFKGGSDGDGPSAGVVEDSKGNLYGTTSVGGDASCDCGVIFELTKL